MSILTSFVLGFKTCISEKHAVVKSQVATKASSGPRVVCFHNSERNL